jgi:hypothetical protein
VLGFCAGKSYDHRPEWSIPLKRFILRSPQKPASASEAAPESLTLPAPQPPGQGWLRGFVALRQRNYRLYWFGQMISVITYSKGL